MTKFNSDIDIDIGDREKLLAIIDHTPAVIKQSRSLKKHGSGVYVTDIPYDAAKNWCALDYEVAESRGYVKLDLLNISLYKSVKDETHLTELMQEPDWSLLNNRKFFQQIIHIGKHYSTMKEMPEPINSIPRMAMFLAVIRPGKRHLIGKTWEEVAKSIWTATADGFTFKKSHSLAYGHLVVVHMNLLKHSPNKSN